MKIPVNISGVHYTPRLRCLVPVLRRWIALNGQLAEHWLKQDDCPWWYKERALLGTFCGSLWLSDNLALEEYSDLKRVRNKRGQLTPDTYAGRVDLYFEVGNQPFVAESKHVWVAATNRKSQKVKIQECIQQTSGDIRQSKRDSRVRRLAIVFAPPYLRVKGKSSLTQRDLKDGALWSVEQAQKTNPDAMAWTFPRLGRYGKYKGGICPGVILLVKEV
jgi:hypothetical protein